MATVTSFDEIFEYVNSALSDVMKNEVGDYLVEEYKDVIEKNIYEGEVQPKHYQRRYELLKDENFDRTVEGKGYIELTVESTAVPNESLIGDAVGGQHLEMLESGHIRRIAKGPWEIERRDGSRYKVPVRILNTRYPERKATEETQDNIDNSEAILEDIIKKGLRQRGLDF